MSGTPDLPPLPEDMRWKIVYKFSTDLYHHYKVLLQKKKTDSFWLLLPEEWRWKTVVKVNEGVRRDPARIPIMGKTFEAAMREAAISAYRKYKESASPRSGTGTYYPR